MKYFFVAFVLIASISFAGHFPQPNGYVNDFAGLLPNEQALESRLQAFEQNTTIEIAVVTIEILPEDQTLFTYGVELFQEWGIGKKGEDNGILVLINKENVQGNRLRIELGYGVQGYITGAEAGRILDDALPHYESGDYHTAVEIILSGLSDELMNYMPGTAPVQRELNPVIGFVLSNIFFIIFLIIFVASALLSNRCPYCRGPIKCKEDYCVCKKCGRKFKRRRKYAPFLVGGGGFGGHSGGFGGGGFGGGGSGGGGAGR